MKRNLIVLVLSVLAIISATACGAGKSEPAGKAKYTSITQEEAKKRMDENTKAIILDVRTKEEYAEGHIKNAILVPNETINNVPPKELPDKNAEILVYCRSGRRSKEAAGKLAAMGYKKVLEFGGISSWKYGVVK